MSEYIVIVLFVLWYGFSLVVSERYGQNRKSGVEGLFFISIIFSPIVGFLIAKFIYKKSQSR